MIFSKHFFSNFLLLLGSVLFGLAITEAGLRLSDSQWELDRAHFSSASKQKILYRFLENGLYALAPNQNSTGQGPCFKASPVTIDNQGFRTVKGVVGDADIVLLGDSFVEALQVPDGLTVADHLAGLTGRAVINAGVSGYATGHEQMAWRQRLAPLHPRLVILMVFLGNDISGNSCALSRTGYPCGSVAQGKIRFQSEAQVRPDADAKALSGDRPEGGDNAAPSSIRLLLRSNLALYALAHDLKVAASGLAAPIFGRTDDRWGLYSSMPDASWEDAWAVTQDALSALREEVEAVGSKLVLVAIPEQIALLPNPETAIRFGAGSALPQGFEAAGPSARIMRMASQLGLPALDLLPVFKAYRDRHNLPAPYFSYACDGHWNPLGHAVASTAIAAFLDGRLDAATYPFPAEVLDANGYQQIFSGGVYRAKAEAE